MEVWELPAFSWMANGVRKTQFKWKERKTREAERETVTEAGSTKETKQV